MTPSGGGVSATIARTAATDLVGLAATGVAVQVHLDLSGLAVIALGAGRRERVTPEVLDMLNVGGVGPQPLDQFVAEAVCFVAWWLRASSTMVTRLSVSYSPKTCPTRLAAMVEGASGEACATLWIRPTSSCGTRALVEAASASQKIAIGMHSLRIRSGIRGVPSVRDVSTVSRLTRSPSGFVQTEDVGVVALGRLFHLDHAVDGDAAAQVGPVGLGPGCW